MVSFFMTKCNISSYKFSKVKGREIEVNFTGGDITSDGGAVLIREADNRLGLVDEISNHYPDNRDPSKIIHEVPTMLKQRIYSIALHYEDLNDHDHLKSCISLQSAVGVAEDMASSSTLCRFENKADRNFIIECHKAVINRFVDSFASPPTELILDFDATDDETHGNQEGKYYHGYYRHNCFLPLYVFCGKQLLVSYLRKSSDDQARHSLAILSLLVKRLRSEWPAVKIIFRGDAGFCRHKMFDWCEANNVGYIVGMGQNARLNKVLAPTMTEAKLAFDKSKEKQRLFTKFSYKAASWSCERNIVGKAEVTNLGENSRYIVTNLEGDAEYLYSTVYCARGDMENRIKEQQLELFADRTSAHKWWSNQLRLMLSSLAYCLLNYIREKLLHGTEFAKYQVGTIRLKLLKIGGVVVRNTRKIKLLLSSTYPYQHIWDFIANKLALG